MKSEQAVGKKKKNQQNHSSQNSDFHSTDTISCLQSEPAGLPEARWATSSEMTYLLLHPVAKCLEQCSHCMHMKNHGVPAASPVLYQISELASILFMKLYMVAVLDHARFLST